MNKEAFENIKNISLSNKLSWQNKVFLTFDIDWVSDEVLSYTLDIIEKYNIKATFFVTHRTKLLERMRGNPKIELGVHPNFNPLLCNDFQYGKNVKEIVGYFMQIVPEAISVRSHSVTQNALILNAFLKFNLVFECNHFIPFDSDIILKPFQLWKGKMIKVPYFWEDDVHHLFEWDWNVEKIANCDGLKVFNFHPIHVFLNTENINGYEIVKNQMQNIEYLRSHINDKNYGTYKFLIDLIEKSIK